MNKDAALIEAFQTGDRDAFAELIRRYQNYVATVAYSATGDFARSEDITQQTFLTAWQNHGELKDPSRWIGWLRGIARNLLRNDYRKRAAERARQEVAAMAAPDVAAVATPLENCISQEQSQLLWSILEQIPETYREPLVLYYREGKSVSAVAKLMDLSPDAVKQRLARGRKLVKAEISEFVEESLFDTKPDHRLTAAIIAALPATGSSVAAKVGGAAVGSLLSLKTLTLLAGPAIGVAGAVFGSRASLKAAKSEQERAFLWKMIFASVGLVAILLVWQLVGWLWMKDFFTQPIVIATTWVLYSIALIALIVEGNRRLARIKQEYDPPDEQERVSAAVGKPISTMALRWNALGSSIGSSVFVFICAGLAGDWLIFGIAAVMLGAIGVMIWRWAPDCRTVSSQVRLNAWVVLATTMPLAGLVFLKWDIWSPVIKVEPVIAGWILALGIGVFGLMLFAFLMRQAGRFEARANP